MSSPTKILIDETTFQRIAQQFKVDDVDRCLALLKDVNIGADQEPLKVGRAKNRFSAVLDRARAGHAQVIQPGRGNASPVVMLSAEALVRLMCLASSPGTVGEIMRGLPAAPSLARPLRSVNRGGNRQTASIPGRGLRAAAGRTIRRG